MLETKQNKEKMNIPTAIRFRTQNQSRFELL